MKVLSLDGLTRLFGDLVGVRDLSFSIDSGHVVGFLGPNGAGETTTLRMILDILRLSRGTIEVQKRRQSDHPAIFACDGKVLWDFDTAGQTYRTINGVGEQSGGPIDVSSGTIADGMLFLISGYHDVAGGGADNVLLAFSVDSR
jgi:ABC-type polar amino acid transport system ATPase subunit